MNLSSISTFLFFFLFNVLVLNAQEIKELPKRGIFAPTIEQIENLNQGIIVYDQYLIHIKEKLVRKDSMGQIVNGKYIDFYESGQKLHEGKYIEGNLVSFTNYYPNGQIERKYSGKADGSGSLSAFYSNGNKRFNRIWQAETPIQNIVYADNGNKIIEEYYNKKNYTPTSIITYHENGKMKSKTSPKKELLYTVTQYYDNGKIKSQGESAFSKENEELTKVGNWLEYDQNNQIISDIDYADNGEVAKVNKGEAPQNIIASNSNNDNAQNINSKVPSNIILFDKNNDGEISTMEMTKAVDLFFDDDTIELAQIQQLINFFFDQE